MEPNNDNEVFNGDDNEEMLMYFENETADKDSFFKLTVFQITVCTILTAVIFLMSFAGGFRKKISEAVEYFQSFELTGGDIKNEISAMRDFLNNEEV